MEIRLARLVKPVVQRDGNRLILDFPKNEVLTSRTSTPTPVGNQRATLATLRTVSDQPMEKPGATTGDGLKMTKVEVRRGDAEAVVKIFGDGELPFESRMVGPSRLVVDFAGVSSALGRKVLPVDHPLLKRIRIGQHPDGLRLVFDLPTPVTFQVQPHKDYLEVSLSPAEPPVGAASPRKSPMADRKKPTASTPPVAKKLSLEPQSSPGSLANRLSLDERKPRLAQIVPTKATGVGARMYRGRRISLDFQGADIANVFRLIAEVSGLNIVVGEKVKAKVTMKLLNVPWDQALEMLLRVNNLGMVKEGNIVWIDTLSNISSQQNAAAKAEESKLKAEPLVTRVIYVQNVSADDIVGSLGEQLSPRGKVQVNKPSNALVLQDVRSKVSEFVQLVKQLDLVVPQVQIEGRIVQADTSYARSFGVQWGFEQVRAPGDGTFTVVGNITGPFLQPSTGNPGTGEFTRDFLVNLPAAIEGLSRAPSVGVNTGKFLGERFALDMRLSAGELLGLVKTLAAPKITTLDKQKAKIEQGESIPFQTTSLQGTQTTFVDANLELEVTPQITSRDPREKNKNILMTVKVTRNSVGERSNPAGPSIDKKEAQTQVLVRDGETMVIGGIFLDEQRNTVGGVPYLSRIPVLGWLFKNKTENVSKQELLIFLTPTIVS